MFQDPTAVAISGGTGIIGFRVDGPFPDGGPPPGYAPAVTTDPVLVNYPMVDTAQAYTSGAASGNPTPTLTRQWMLDGVAIPGETGTTYTPVIGDLGSLLSIQETWTNTFGTASAESVSWLVTPEMAAATDHKYIDPTLGADDGGPYSSGDAYIPSFPLADGSVAPAGNIYATCKLAFDSETGDGHRYYLRKGYCHDPESGVFFTSQFSRSDTLFSSYGPADADLPVLDAVVYLSDATGWTPNGSKAGAWDYALTGVTENNSDCLGALWVGRQNNGDLTTDRVVGIMRRKATSIANLSLTNGSANQGLWFITAGSPSTLTVMATVDEAPPVYHDGIGLVIENLSGSAGRGIVMYNGASNNRVEHLVVSGPHYRPLAIATSTSDSVCDSNAFVNVTFRSFIGDGLRIAGVNASRTVTNTFISGVSAVLDSDTLANDEGSNDFQNSNPFAIAGFTDGTYYNNISYEGHNCHTAIDPTLTSNVAPANVYFDGVTITYLPGTTDGRAFGGYIEGGYLRNFTFTGCPTRSQFGGIDFEVAYGTVTNTTNTNKTPKDQFQAFHMTHAGNPTNTPTANFTIHDVDFYMSGTPNAKAPIWFHSNPASYQSSASEVEIYNCRAFLSNTQGLVVRSASSTNPTPWEDQNIHDNTVINASLIAQNYSTSTGDSSSPTYTTEALNGFFGCANNTVSAS